MGERRGIYRALVGKPEGKKTTWKTQDIDGKIILKWILEKWDGAVVNAVMNLRVP